jgi:hypothetical protein
VVELRDPSNRSRFWTAGDSVKPHRAREGNTIMTKFFVLAIILGISQAATASEKRCADFNCLPAMVAAIVAQTPQGISDVIPAALHSNPDFVIGLGEAIRNALKNLPSKSDRTQSISLDQRITSSLLQTWGPVVDPNSDIAKARLTLLVQRTLLAVYDTSYNWKGSDIPKTLHTRYFLPKLKEQGEK